MSVNPAELRHQALSKAHDLIAQLPLPPGTALAATGSLAREQLTPESDLDLVLLHPAEIEISPKDAEALWYPIWNAGYKLDYSVRTPQECVDMVTADSTAALALLDIAPLIGDIELVAKTRSAVLRQWRLELNRDFSAVVDTAISRWRRSGSVVAMTHPNLKHGRGGLRDVDLLKALALGHLTDMPVVDKELELILNVRTLLHVNSGRERDILDPHQAAEIAVQMGFRDRFELACAIAQAARIIDKNVTAALAKAREIVSPRSGKIPRRPLDIDVIERGGTIVLAKNANLEDSGLVLRVAAAAARNGLSIDESTWRRLAKVPKLSQERWPRAVAEDFINLLSSPDHSARVIEELDDRGLWEPMVPEWANIRDRMPAEPVHIHTIDVHCLLAVQNAASASISVSRPDLLLVAALYHDIGKGQGRAHSIVGAEYVARAAARLGFDQADRARLQTVVAEHSFIGRVAATMDPNSEVALEMFLQASNYDLLTVELLGALAEADALATGPGIWSPSQKATRDILIKKARKHLIEVRPRKPLVNAPDEIGMRPHSEDPSNRAVIYWRGTYQREIIRVLAVIHASGWTIDAARYISENEHSVAAEFDVRATASASLDASKLVQVYRSGVHSGLPPVQKAPTAVLWDGNVVEVRSKDRRALLGNLLSVLPNISWMNMQARGGIMQFYASLPDLIRHPEHREVVSHDITLRIGFAEHLS
ncbi:[protein-PII] uridylyltransferase [Corynebacterium caspium]|uniref:[protein-PII] uridylyltransferase n=1 Tax=Corynebacterium caspium TaxID=234828 RepID=UPI00036505A3|nr:[protein-PII] uridylyltransferase [Corynebacterium caspium]WKD59052.1 Bifunctional uridylyltransferase/uridylyl-removing enzyme [Corynebacterium caspium DSM 44850]